MNEKPDDQFLNSVQDGGKILKSPKADERTQLDTDIENTQKELPEDKSVRCGNITFSQQCSALDFFHYDIYGHVTFDLCHFEESIIWGNLQPTRTHKGSIELGIGLTPNLEKTLPILLPILIARIPQGKSSVSFEISRNKF